MNKPDSLRQALNQGIEYLASNPDALQLYVDKGAVVSSGVPANGWEYRYTLNVVITDYAGDQNIVMAVVCNWLSNHQPDALNNPELRKKFPALKSISCVMISWISRFTLPLQSVSLLRKVEA
jgi:hypothetical protein